MFQDGTFADYFTLPEENLHAVPEGISEERAVFAEPLAAAFRIIEQNLVKKTDRVAVLGDGKLGLLIAMVMGNYLEDSASNLTLFGRHQDKMDLLSGKLQSVVIDAPKAVGKSYHDKFDVCIEASGKPQGFQIALDVTRPLGTVVYKTTCNNVDGILPYMPAIVIKELTVVGSRCGNFEMALEALSLPPEMYPVEKLITATFPMDAILEAVKHSQTVKGVMKVQVIMHEI